MAGGKKLRAHYGHNPASFYLFKEGTGAQIQTYRTVGEPKVKRSPNNQHNHSLSCTSGTSYIHSVPGHKKTEMKTNKHILEENGVTSMDLNRLQTPTMRKNMIHRLPTCILYQLNGAWSYVHILSTTQILCCYYQNLQANIIHISRALN